MANLKKQIKVLGRTSSHQWGIVVGSGGVCPSETASQHKYPQIVVKKWKRKSSM